MPSSDAFDRQQTQIDQPMPLIIDHFGPMDLTM
jgi:hypothetical protein